MSERKPSSLLVVDANILITAILGRAGPGTIGLIAADRALISTPEAKREVSRVLSDPRFKRPVPDLAAEAVLTLVPMQPVEFFEDLTDEAARCLRDAVASANGSEADSHILALAWAADADIWSHDRDFGGSGWPSWSTRNLRRALDI
jgi:predicted nucleic acid-binding protein